MIIENSKLKLVALSYEDFMMLLDRPNKLAEKFKLSKNIENLDSETRFAFEWLIKQCRNYPESHIWFTNWQIILKSENAAIGSFCFKGEPNHDGEIEIGYGISKDYQNRGYMSETIAMICKWLPVNEKVKTIYAETDKDNLPSQKVLQKNSFIKSFEREKTFWWSLKIRD